MPAVLNNGLCSWARASWYLEECEATEAGTGVPKFWRLGPKPNLTQLHDSYKRQAMKYAKNQFNELAKTKCAPLYEDPYNTGVLFHKLPEDPNDIEDDGRFRIANPRGRNMPGSLASLRKQMPQHSSQPIHPHPNVRT